MLWPQMVEAGVNLGMSIRTLRSDIRFLTDLTLQRVMTAICCPPQRELNGAEWTGDTETEPGPEPM